MACEGHRHLGGLHLLSFVSLSLVWGQRLCMLLSMSMWRLSQESAPLLSWGLMVHRPCTWSFMCSFYSPLLSVGTKDFYIFNTLAAGNTWPSASAYNNCWWWHGTLLIHNCMVHDVVVKCCVMVAYYNWGWWHVGSSSCINTSHAMWDSVWTCLLSLSSMWDAKVIGGRVMIHRRSAEKGEMHLNFDMVWPNGEKDWWRCCK